MFGVNSKSDWFEKIEENPKHKIAHYTSFERARSILEDRIIRGYDTIKTSHEAFPHFIYNGWGIAKGTISTQIRLNFETTLPVRLRTDGGAPEPNYLEVYQTSERERWQCSVHPDSPSLTYVGSCPDWRELERKLPSMWSLGAWTEAGREWRRLIKLLELSELEGRKIGAGFG